MLYDPAEKAAEAKAQAPVQKSALPLIGEIKKLFTVTFSIFY
jgi:hypothetical protein